MLRTRCCRRRHHRWGPRCGDFRPGFAAVVVVAGSKRARCGRVVMMLMLLADRG